MSPQDVVGEVSRSGLRGRGGAGFPTGVKWGLVARTQAEQKYVICNGDEGDPGAYMDRSVMEGDPHRLLEGMAIAAYAVGASQGFIYVRGEYPVAIRRLQRAIRQAERQRILGTRIFDTPFQFRVDIRIGGGAFVCGEETALIASIEGGRGWPHPRPPYPAQVGLWGQPTLINNVETFAAIAPGESLLEVIRDHGGSVPTLCQFEGLSTPGACRLCLVEVAGRPKPAAACVTSADEGLEVRTTSERLERYRKMTLELLLAERNHICSVCVVNGHCELQDLASGAGIDHVRFDYAWPTNLRVDASHPLFVLDENRCVLCTRCVRICDEVEGVHTWDLSSRGIGTRVITDLATPWGESISCTSCGKCVQVCPTGALSRKGVTVAEMVKDREKLNFLTEARRERVWDLRRVVKEDGA